VGGQARLERGEQGAALLRVEQIVGGDQPPAGLQDPGQRRHLALQHPAAAGREQVGELGGPASSTH